jgi:sodium-dependent dicarboxylate transporter 2/3/5
VRQLTLVLGPLAGAILGLSLAAAGLANPICWTAGITLTTAIWWVFESLPIAAASLLPFAALPAAGVLTHQEAAAALGNPVILLLMGGLMLSRGIERSRLHERFALGMIRALGGNGGRGLVFAFVLTAALISMWISNAATALMLMPMAVAIIDRSNNPRLAVPLVLAVAYGASVGGVGTLIGTPPNLIFAAAYQQTAGSEFGFLRWMTIGVPIVLLAAPVVALWLGRKLGAGERLPLEQAGPWRTAEWRVLLVFGLTVLAWLTRAEPFGGWTGLVRLPGIDDSTLALAGVVVMFLVRDGAGSTLLDWETAAGIPWGMLLLFAGGICLAAGFTASGLDQLIAGAVTGLTALPTALLMLAICLVVVFLTEITSNTAVATLLMPVMAAVATGTGTAPELLMIPAAIAATCGFMLPVGTAPNAIAYGTGRVTTAQMAREGLVLNVVVAVIVAGVCYAVLG